MNKKYKLTASEIKRMVPDMGFAFVSDKIAVEGRKVEYMVRQEPEREEDSGWTFYGGQETQEYMDDPNNLSLLEVNTIANYDPGIIPFLTYPPGTELERKDGGKLELITKDIEKPDVVLLGPVKPGMIAITKTWRFEVLSCMLKRIDSGSLVIWRPEFTIWLNVYGTKGKSIQERINGILKEKSKDAYEIQQEEKDGLLKLRYQLTEKHDCRVQKSVYLFGLTSGEQIQMTIYYDDDEDMNEINRIWQSLSSVQAK